VSNRGRCNAPSFSGEPPARCQFRRPSTPLTRRAGWFGDGVGGRGRWRTRKWRMADSRSSDGRKAPGREGREPVGIRPEAPGTVARCERADGRRVACWPEALRAATDRPTGQGQAVARGDGRLRRTLTSAALDGGRGASSNKRRAPWRTTTTTSRTAPVSPAQHSNRGPAEFRRFCEAGSPTGSRTGSGAEGPERPSACRIVSTGRSRLEGIDTAPLHQNRSSGLYVTYRGIWPRKMASRTPSARRTERR